MTELLVLFIVASQVTLYLLIGFMFRALQRKYQQRNSSELQQALITSREEATGEHRIDIATLEAEEEVVRCRVCAFANTQQFRFCVICGEKLKLSPTEKARARGPLTARQLRARRRSEWLRQMKSGEVFWYREAAQECFQYPGYVPVFYREEDGNEEETDSEAIVEPPDGEPGWVIAKLLNETRLMRIQTVPAEEANALAFATGAPSSRNADIKGFLDLSKEDFPTKFAHFMACTSSLIVPAELEVLKLFVRRDHVVEESMEYFCCMDDSDTRAVVRIDFAAETAVDAGGVHREWFTLVTELMIDPSLGVFTCTNRETQTFFFNANSNEEIGEEHLAYFFAVGRLVGRALLDGEVMGFHFAPALLKIILGIPLTFRDYEDFDPTTYKSLLWMLENDGANTLELDFTATRRGGRGDVVTVELVPNGGDIPVTDANKHSFAEHWLRYFLLESVSDQLYVFLKGLYQVIPRQILMLFDAEEFDYVLCGCDTIDVTDWETHTRCSRNLTGTRVLRWFWELVRDMNPECRRRLLQFATGCSRVPIGGFRHLTSHDGQICPFTLKGVQSAYIRSHACFNRLDLPLTSTRTELKEVLYATLNTETYGFTTAESTSQTSSMINVLLGIQGLGCT